MAFRPNDTLNVINVIINRTWQLNRSYLPLPSMRLTRLKIKQQAQTKILGFLFEISLIYATSLK